MRNFLRFAQAAGLAWMACAVAAAISGLFATALYIAFYQDRLSSASYKLHSFAVVFGFGLVMVPFAFFGAFIQSLPVLVLAWSPTWCLRAKFRLFDHPVLAFLIGLAVGLIYWSALQYVFRAHEPGRKELVFAAYVGAAFGSAFMFLVGSLFRLGEKASG